ncbi:MAG: endonuclease MutS2 [Bacteroidetes bacterium]|nr:endonuclease MutS2 [Bacteroidota bacterium]
MIYPHNFEEKAGFDLIRQRIGDYCQGPLGRAYIGKIEFRVILKDILPELNKTDELKRMMEAGEHPPMQDMYDLVPEIERIRIPGSVITLEVLPELKLSLETIAGIIRFLRAKGQSDYPHLFSLTLFSNLDLTHLTHEIGKIIDAKGNIRDDASPQLLKIRKSLHQKRGLIEKKTRQILQLARDAGWTAGDAELTLREGRFVVPVLHSHKRKITGFIVDESATGQTCYIEPAETVEVSNEVRSLELNERREIHRILVALTEVIRESAEELIQHYAFLGEIDFLHAKARLALELGAVMPVIQDEPLIQWVGAIHPLLFLSHRKARKPVVPLDLTLDKHTRILVISGPNAGGKSVCLKTVGLLQYMLQCGLLVPVQPHSGFGIFHQLFIDIGDEQSLENDLSTYSSHLLNIKYLIEHANQHTLFLIDEFGSGTEPNLGGAIAEATLEAINSKGSKGIVTTHYANLKMLQGKIEGIVNGAMLFDNRKMKPLYKMKTGKPGHSFAFEIAQQIGFPADILQVAHQKGGASYLDFDRQLQDLETEKESIQKRGVELEVADNLLFEVIRKYEKLVEEMESSKGQIIEEAKQHATELIALANRQIEKTIKEIRESQADKDQTKELRKQLEITKKEISINAPKKAVLPKTRKVSVISTKTTPPSEIVSVPIETGSFVVMKGQRAIGKVIGTKGDTIQVMFGSMKLKTTRDKLESVHPGETEILSGISSGERHQGIIQELNRRMADFHLTLDIRGRRGEEAVAIVQKYLDDAILLRIHEVRILHGKGDGILRRLVREYVGGLKEVREYRDEYIEQGGHGITVVTFK